MTLLLLLWGRDLQVRGLGAFFSGKGTHIGMEGALLSSCHRRGELNITFLLFRLVVKNSENGGAGGGWGDVMEVLMVWSGRVVNC